VLDKTRWLQPAHAKRDAQTLWTASTSSALATHRINRPVRLDLIIKREFVMWKYATDINVS
jgi:hypothetical protein